MKLFGFLLISFWTVVVAAIATATTNANKWVPNIQLLEIISSPDNATERIRQVPKARNSEVIVGEDVGSNSRLVIKCNATFPVQIIYIGTGRPEFSTFTNVQWREDPQNPLTFEAEASLGLLGFQGALRELDSGNYSCRSIQNSTILSYYYIYVPGPSLFTAPDDYNSELYFSPQDKSIWVPCTAAHPQAVVSLHKTASGKVQCPGIERNVATYDPHRGFLLSLKDSSLKKPEGTYVCIGAQGDNFRMSQYKLIATNGSDSGRVKGPCRPSPCGQKAECSVVDGNAVCYCQRGMSGNPYNECGQGQETKGRCHSNADCTNGKFCVHGKCTVDPCQPSPCGKGSVCTSHGGRPRCMCQPGYDGKPPYCLRKCHRHNDCPQNEICSRTHCQAPCPNQCGTNAVCQVVHAGHNRSVVCTCPPGFTGIAEENCYDIGKEPEPTVVYQPGPQCPLGFIGPGPPHCRKIECTENSDCPRNKYCSADRLCMVVEEDACRVCGLNAECQLARSQSKPVCYCPDGMTGDPFVRCFTNTVSNNATFVPPTRPSSPHEPCDPNPCPVNSACRPKYFFGRAESGAFDCVCLPGYTGNPPNCYPQTVPESPNKHQSFPESSRPPERFPQSFPDSPRPPERFPQSSPESSQRPKYPESSNRPSRPPSSFPQSPSSFPDSAQIPHHFHPDQDRPPPSQFPESAGRPFPFPASGQIHCIEDHDCPQGLECVARLCIPEDNRPPQCRSRCGLNAECIHGSCVCLNGTIGDPRVSCQPKRSPCSPSPCANFAECRETEEGKAACRCILGYEGDAFTFCRPEKLSRPGPSGPPPGYRDNDNSPTPNFNRERDRPLLQPQPFDNDLNNYPNRFHHKTTGPPRHFPSTGREECDPRRREGNDCGQDYQCRVGKDGIPKCVCASFRCGYVEPARPPNIPEDVIYGRYCHTDGDCEYPEICSNVSLNCYNPCDYDHSPCNNVAFSECRVIEGKAICTCRRGYVGNPSNGLDCRRDFPPDQGSSTNAIERDYRVTPLHLVYCDIDRRTGCDARGECRLVDDGRGQCFCGIEYVGTYPDCRLRCRTNKDCFNAHECFRNECIDPCERGGPCGKNASCRVKDHVPICECFPNFFGDPWVACLQNRRSSSSGRRGRGFEVNCDGEKCTLF